MSTINPIDRVTDPSFTESAKGLMTLFCIGAIHTVIGIELIDAKIAVPWFPTINFKHPEYLIYLYWAFNFYAIYRYSLHNSTLIREYWFNSLVQGLKSPSGHDFINKTIWFSEQPYKVESKRRKGRSINVDIIGFFFMNTQVPGEKIQENVYYFTFKFSENYRFKGIECSIDDNYSVDGACFDNKEITSKWGLSPFIDDNGREEYCADFIKSKGYRLRLFKLRILPYVYALLTSKSIFDLILPILLNILLFFAWLLFN